jgi:hypothetical protein
LERIARPQAAFQRPFWSRWRHALIRRRYRLRRDNRPVCRAWNTAQLEVLTASLHAWRFLKNRF